MRLPWKVEIAVWGSPRLAELLAAGWEPFAVVADGSGTDVFLRWQGGADLTYWREPDPGKRCGKRHPDFPKTLCNRTRGHAGEHRYSSPADGRSIEWAAS